MKRKIALVRGKFLNQFDMQSYEPLTKKYDITAFGSQTSLHSIFSFPTIKLFSPLDLPDFPYNIQILNRIFRDAHYLYGLENALNGFDIAHTAETYFRFTNQCLIAKKKRYIKKVIVTVWENIPFNNEGIRGRKEMKQYVFKETDHFIAVSERAKTALILEGADEKKISVVHPGINTKLFVPHKEKFTSTRHKKEMRVLFAGRLVANKGIFELLYALKLLYTDKDLLEYNILITCIGSGSEKQKMQRMEKKFALQGTITYKEVSYETMPIEYQNADVFVAPSKADIYWQEQWGMALMEAQASGLPIVTTTSGSIPENVGNTAILVQPADVLSLFQGLKQLILDQNLRFGLSKKARERAEKMHDVRIAAQKISNIYEEVLHE